MATFGNRPEDSVTDSKGNVRPGVVITVFATEADAISNRNSIGSASAGSDGRWPIELAGKTVVWAREPNGSVWSVASDTALSDHETRLDTVETELPNKLEAADISGKADVTYVDTGLAAKIDTATANSTFETGVETVLYVDPAGNDSRPGKTASTAKATIAAAVTALAGNPGKIVLSDGLHEVGGGLSLSGAKCSIVGQGAGMLATGVPERTVIKASSQTGPVLDFTGYLWPDGFRGRVEFGGFAIEGSNVADATKNNAGIRVATPSAAAGSAYFHDIVISRTGGPCLDLGAVYLSDFERITLVTPVSAKANDVPYMQAVGANGNRFRGIGFRSMSSSADVGASGVLVMSPGGGFAPHDNAFESPWFEFLHVPTGGCLISIAGNANVIDAPQFFDCSKESGATGTAWARFLVPTGSGVVDIGGNMWRGYVPGKGTNATDIDLGIDVQQSRNSVVGAKGYKGTNVQLASGVTNTFIMLTGANSSASDVAVVDNSGSATNVWMDHYLRTEHRGSFNQDERTAGNGGAGPRFQDPATPTNGAVWLGTSGPRVQAVGTSMYETADAVFLRNIALGNSFTFILSSAPGLIFPDHGTLPTATSALRGKVVVVRGAAGVADQMYVCRKNAADAYEWAALA